MVILPVTCRNSVQHTFVFFTLVHSVCDQVLLFFFKVIGPSCNLTSATQLSSSLERLKKKKQTET